MSKVLLWIIGIGVVVIAAAFVLVGVAPFVLARLGLMRMPMAVRPAVVAPGFLGFLFGAGRLGFRAPMFALYQLTSCLWPLLLIGLIVWAFTALTQRPAPMSSLPPYMPAPPPPAPASQAVCPNCGQPLQAGWRHCPNCGQALSQ